MLYRFLCSLCPIVELLYTVFGELKIKCVQHVLILKYFQWISVATDVCCFFFPLIGFIQTTFPWFVSLVEFLDSVCSLTFSFIMKWAISTFLPCFKWNTHKLTISTSLPFSFYLCLPCCLASLYQQDMDFDVSELG